MAVARKAPAKPAKKAAAKKASPRKPPARPSKRFRARGQRLWDAHREQVEGERGLVMLEEACRIADRLDQLDRILKGEVEAWCYIAEARDGDLEVRVDGALVEARQQANVLRQILSSLPIRGGDDGEDAEGWLDSL